MAFTDYSSFISIMWVFGGLLLWLQTRVCQRWALPLLPSVAYGVVLLAWGVMWVPLGEASLSYWLRGVFGHFSVSTCILMLPCYLPRHSLWTRQDRQLTIGAIAAATLFLYPMALGWGHYDPYTLGFASVALGVVLCALACIAWWLNAWLCFSVMVLSVLAYCISIYESNNVWDYLLDPMLGLYAVVLVLKQLCRCLSRRRSRSRQYAV